MTLPKTASAMGKPIAQDVPIGAEVAKGKCGACGWPNDRAGRFDTCSDCMAAGCPLDYTDPRKCSECDCGKPTPPAQLANIGDVK